MPGSVSGRPSITVSVRGGAPVAEPVASEPTPASNTTAQAGRTTAVSTGRPLASSSTAGGLRGIWNRFINWLSGKGTSVDVSKNAKKSDVIAEQTNLNTGAAAYFVTNNMNEQNYAQAEDEKRSKDQPSGIMR